MTSEKATFLRRRFKVNSRTFFYQPARELQHRPVYDHIRPFIALAATVHTNLFTFHFSSLEDPRQSAKVTYPLFDILFSTICVIGCSRKIEICLALTDLPRPTVAIVSLC